MKVPTMTWLLLLATLLSPVDATAPAPPVPVSAQPPKTEPPPFEAIGFVMGETRAQTRARESQLTTLPGGKMAVNRRIAGESALLVLTFLDDRLVKVSAGFNVDGDHDAEWTLILARRLAVALEEKLGAPPVQRHEPALAYHLLVDDYYLAVWPQGGVKASIQITMSRGLPLLLVVYEIPAATDRVEQQLRHDLANDL
jgi:hypothetical protein